MAVSEVAMLDRGRKGARCESGFFERSLAMGNTVEFSDVLLEPSEAAAFLKGQPLLVGKGACNE